MEIIRITEDTAAQVVSLAAEFRASLRALKGIVSKPDPDEGKKEIAEFLQAGFPVYAAKEGSTCVGYIVCRIEGTVLWSEQIYVAKDHRRKGVASALFAKAEEIAASMGEDTIYNYVQGFLDGKYSREMFWSLARFKNPTHQISFHTENALQTIRFIEGVKVYEE